MVYQCIGLNNPPSGGLVRRSVMAPRLKEGTTWKADGWAAKRVIIYSMVLRQRKHIIRT